ncbi:microvitellogenin-like [Manduca sexta]|uniref:microvitellogenin-like n=1 Tax=Manduca sexta TaxID=7130 RepID=UPI0018907993|nr:microvitellogenin-like [Manduca sexta]
MLRITLLLALAALACHGAPTSDDVAVDRMYKSVIVGDYESAVALSKDLEKQKRGDVIALAVNKLIDESQRNVMDFALYLWRDAKDLVKNYFPLEFRSILGQHLVKLISKRDNMVVKLNSKVDGDGDRMAYGDSNHNIGDRMAWKLIPVEDSQVYFKMYNPLTNQYLKAGVKVDSDGDHTIYGSSQSNENRHQFYLVPVRYDGQVLFYIYNREFQQALKLGRAVDSDGDRIVYTEHGNVVGDPYSFGWKIKPL